MTEQELSEKLRVMIRGYLRHYTDSARDSSVYANEVLSLITADRKRVALEARQDELTKAFTAVVGDKNAPSSRYSKITRLFNKYLLERHEQLKAQQEEI